MAQATQKYSRSLSASIGAGMKSLVGDSGRRYYVLEHKVSSKYHKAGEDQKIIVDQIELGRDPKCQVRFDESFGTVSRRHTAIVKDGDNWKLVQLSKTNSTYLNGHKVDKEWYLQNGDEIQLSTNGPKMGFIVPEGEKGLVKSIGLTQRMSLFRQQALRPYKKAITALAGVLVIGIIASGIVFYQQHSKIQSTQTDLIATQTELNSTKADLQEAVKANAQNKDLIAELNKVIDNQGGMLDSLKKIKPKIIHVHDGGGSTPGSDGIDMSACNPHVYLITATTKINGEEFNSWVGTGFQLNDGKFVTARHVVTPYYSNNYHIQDGKVIPHVNDPMAIFADLYLNIMHQMGKVSIEYSCVSPSNRFTLNNSNVSENSNSDRIHTLEQPFQLINKNNEVVAEIPAGSKIREGGLGAVDFAYFNNSSSDGLRANKQLSTNLKQGTNLYILGYPHGWGKGKPIFSTAVCAQDGLSRELGGTIMASNDNTEGGNSGGPIFVKDGAGWSVVGIVSGGSYAKGRFVPISVIP